MSMSHQTRTVFAGALLSAALWLPSLGIAAPAHADDGYGIITYSPATGITGTASGADDKLAESFALASCAQQGGTGCVVKLLFRNGCGAFALNGGQEGLAHKESIGEAEAAALAMAGGGAIKASLCVESGAAAQQAPKQGPGVTANEGALGVTFTVTDRSGVASQCTYSSEGFKKTFALPANGTVDVFVPAVRLFKERTGEITCDNGTSTPTSVFY